ncbi:MAG TPA: NAD(P)(+) transhydrogenase (Re/Si-specific) subunit beta [Vicinamibacterales bacterium]|nr:NAD(P)(+) transhydrogenase (Re/Si-specific) subunit beta [Vicinamibacterales bacterium]
MNQSLINLAYLVAAVLFILGLKGLAHPKTAVRANLLGAVGMLIAIVATLLDRIVLGGGAQAFALIFAAILIGSVLGAILALKIQMTAMPQMVALLNGFGGGASVLVAGAALSDAGAFPSIQLLVATAASGIIGAVTFWGSLVAFDKLQETFLPSKPIHFPGQQPLNAVLAAACLVLSYWLVTGDASARVPIYWIVVVIASVAGVLLSIPIGGADMPVAIALLNSYSGLAAAATGFVLDNDGLIITGSLVGASGIILSQIMCKAMNRSLANVLLGHIGSGEGGPKADDVYGGKVKSTSAEEIAMLFDGAGRVVIVPGYGLAVSQAQHAVRDLVNLLEARGTEVEFAIHPVAGRMPGHMNVLLAEADISYDKLKEMDQINPTFQQTDVALVIGANDVVNPLARTDPQSPIAGMPILDVDKAHTVVVIKRSLSPGFAGIPNPLFAADNTLMYFADGKKAITDLITAVKEAA